MKENFYQKLGLANNATQGEIKKAYHKIALQFHPDQNPDNKEAEEKFREAKDAYETLSDPAKKTVYDFKLAQDEIREFQQKQAERVKQEYDGKAKFSARHPKRSTNITFGDAILGVAVGIVLVASISALLRDDK